MSEFKGLSSEQMIRLIKEESHRSMVNAFQDGVSLEESRRRLEVSKQRIVEISRVHKETYGEYGLYVLMNQEDKEKVNPQD